MAKKYTLNAVAQTSVDLPPPNFDSGKTLLADLRRVHGQHGYDHWLNQHAVLLKASARGYNKAVDFILAQGVPEEEARVALAVALEHTHTCAVRLATWLMIRQSGAQVAKEIYSNHPKGWWMVAHVFDLTTQRAAVAWARNSAHNAVVAWAVEQSFAQEVFFPRTWWREWLNTGIPRIQWATEVARWALVGNCSTLVDHVNSVVEGWNKTRNELAGLILSAEDRAHGLAEETWPTTLAELALYCSTPLAERIFKRSSAVVRLNAAQRFLRTNKVHLLAQRLWAHDEQTVQHVVDTTAYRFSKDDIEIEHLRAYPQICKTLIVLGSEQVAERVRELNTETTQRAYLTRLELNNRLKNRSLI